MPIYEFYCPDCNTLMNFLSRAVNPAKRPPCPRCGGKKLQREVSAFAVTGKSPEGGGAEEPAVDESRMMRAMESLAGEAESVREDDPRAAANLMRKFSKMTGLQFGGGIEEALGRMEEGEDPAAIEAELGDRMEGEDPFLQPGKGGGGQKRARPPQRDERLYEM